MFTWPGIDGGPDLADCCPRLEDLHLCVTGSAKHDPYTSLKTADFPKVSWG